MANKIELKNINRQAKILKYCGIILIAISVIKIVFINQFNFRGLGEFIDSIIWLLGGSFALYLATSQKMKGRQNQFIEWDDETVTYKLAEQESTQVIEIGLIENVLISIDKISLTMRDDSIYILDISDFKDYEQRKEIKSKFENIKIN
ncbi:hypothetical protein [Rubrolithibacter danxiaensis]|uniref:hypothetical protein n=1 Tax=Rubrolithibacter danxiaensis TaxID=3390805 RepID=UPI003BF89F88